MVRFDTKSDARSSLDDFGSDAAIDVLRCLDEIAQLGLAWDEFKRTFGWMPVKLVGEQTYPGALELHRFYIASRSGSRFQVVGCTYEKVVVVCAIALRN